MEITKLAELLLRHQVVRWSFDPLFTFASGLKSPVYCDNRLLLAETESRRDLITAMGALFRESFDGVAATATAGIPWGAWLADHWQKPLVYVRSAAKGHGTGRLVEGTPQLKGTYLLVEDLVTTGKSSLAAVQALRHEGAEVTRMVSLFSYGFSKTQLKMADAGMDWRTLITFPQVLRVAQQRNMMSDDVANRLLDWHRQQEQQD